MNNSQLEQARRQLNIAYIISGIVAVLPFIIFAIQVLTGSGFVFALMIDGGIFQIIFLFVLYVVGIFLVQKFYLQPRKNEYQSILKDMAYHLVFEKEFEDMTYKHDQGMSSQSLRDVSLIKIGTEYSSNDLMYGTYKDVDFMRADVLSQTTTHDSQNNTSSTTIHFKGQVYRFDFHKEVVGSMWLRDRSFFDRMFGKKGPDSSRSVTFEDENFNSMFTVHSQNDQEAFYVFTPAFMEKVRILRHQCDCPMTLALVGNYIYLALFTRSDALIKSV